MRVHLLRLVAGEPLSWHELEILAQSDAADLRREWRAAKASHRLLRKSRNGVPDAEGGKFLHVSVDLSLHPEIPGVAEAVSDHLSGVSGVEGVYQWAHGRELLLFFQGRTLREVLRFLTIYLREVPGIVALRAQFLLTEFREQGYLRLQG